MVTTEHLDAYLNAMGNRHVEGLEAYMADNVILRSPIVPVPFEGKELVFQIVSRLLETIDDFELKLLLRDGADFVAVFTIKFGDHIIDGMDHMHLDDMGFIDHMTVAWRPLASVVAVQQKLASKLGGKPMQLVPLE
ncbi:nuclear transport factor 2 family protein [Rahnella sp. C60]|uniref:nuclear transport factor 2 family protein n=1 Tax=Rahnella perminowiae TaxID=2816244 RepID=UPI001C258462|nr:nuclear transport factor 2 family protein [Rahnella perminowiae]MBU9813434.1 nuclear transport factor 2 family protein [Rahnella perminowiae]